MTAQFFKEILTEPALKDFEILRLENGEIDAECLDLVMEMAQNNRVLHIKGTDIPIDYYHENAFKFHDIYYDDARWVRIEHLLTLKDSYSVNLVRDHLIHRDVNTFIKYWIDSDHDMVQILSFKAIVSFQTERFFDGIVVLKGRRQATYLVAANPTKQRKRPILSITCYDGMFRLKSWNKDETFRVWGNLIVSWASEYKVLMLLNEKKELEGKLREIQKLLDTSQDQNMVKKKNEIAGELLNVSQEVASLNLVVREGMTAEFFKEILTEPALKDFESLRLDDGKIDEECLDLVMEMAQSNRVLHIKGTMIPFNYYHKNAFKFQDSFYDDAGWVRIEHLLTLKDSYSVSLGWNDLIHSEVNTFIKFWIDSDHDMVQSLSFKAAILFITELLFDGIVVLKARREAKYFVMANPTKQRKRPILSITCYDGFFRLKSWNKDIVESYASEYKVLMMLNKKKELEGKLEEIQKLLETSPDQNVVKKKNVIVGELQNVSQEVSSLNLVLREGVYSYE
ncbi:hypothetical protein CAEBREN_23644 [Caenorhabditis brenneri]|uniref:Uncharacterized protein n=1 Tax=Caenorhabditis brenneri TaxID=135651 RepID=G0PCU3_CAEBE|nr:hypothetical protein CAEBREN_23644 [Caenorhabditis brenneri]